PEVILGIIYAILFLFLFVIDYHYLNIDLANKDNVKTAAREKIANFQNMQAEYDISIVNKQNDFQHLVELAATNFKTNRRNLAPLATLIGTNAVNPNTPAGEIDSKVDSAAKNKTAVIRAIYELDSLNKASEEYLNTAQSVFDDWKLLKVSYYYKDIDSFYMKYYAKAKSKMSDFGYKPVIKDEYQFTEPLHSIKSSPVLRILLFLLGLVVMHLCILAPYFATKRAQRILKENTTNYDDTGSITSYLKNKQ
ncbi:MAG TPA: hypothetical protein VKH37_07260, partial [Ferruginibacter sp.]|nr:hypothetical protein [Ferruginibacter sp.]